MRTQDTAQQQEQQGGDDLTTIYITNVTPSMKEKLQAMAKEEMTTLAPMVKKILRRAIKNYDATGDFFHALPSR
ncbi:MAG: hypothetical protein KF744_09020 [Taibaiella sp.]|nr:hypothetical protein [Taibaiella sp.]